MQVVIHPYVESHTTRVRKPIGNFHDTLLFVFFHIRLKLPFWFLDLACSVRSMPVKKWFCWNCI